MVEFILSAPLRPFILAYGLVLGFLFLEIALMMVGLSSSIDQEGEAAPGTKAEGFALEADTDTSGSVDPSAFAIEGLAEDIPLTADGVPDKAALLASLDIAGQRDTRYPLRQTPRGLSGWLGLHEAPLMLWLAALAFGFGTAGWIIQLAASGLWTAFPPLPAVLMATLPGLFFARRFALVFGQIIPRAETTAISQASFGRRIGRVTVGVARAGQPAQVRFTDGHGNMHHAMAEPFSPGDEIPEGAEVMIIRRRDGSLGLIQID